MQKLASIPMPSGDIFKDGCSPFDYIHNKIIGLKKREKTEDKGMRNLLLHNILHAKTDECNATFSKDVKSYDVEVNLLSYNQKLKIF